MIPVKMKKISMLILRADFDKFIRELILFGCVDIDGPSGDPPDDTELTSLARRELIDLEQYQTCREHLAAYGTDYTILLTGWIPSKSVQNLLTILSGYIHAWDVRDPTPDEHSLVPVKLAPKFLTVLYRGSRRLFSPLIFEERAEESV